VEQYARYHGELSALQVVMSGAEASIGIYRELGPEVHDRAREVLDRLGAGTLKHRAFSVLSQGERQRVVLARAWLAQPEILILDEPTTALDMVAREALLTGLTRLVEDSKTPPTVIYVTHAVDEVLPWFSHVLLLRQGKVVAQGEKAKVLADDPLRHAFELSVQLVWRDGRPFVTLGSYAERGAVPANQK
jgi:iron complex transport system ATP-binding protein